MDLKNYIAESRRTKDSVIGSTNIQLDDQIFTPVDKENLIRNSEANTMFIYATNHLTPIELNQKIYPSCYQDNV
jgi:hypothetical protein